MKRPPGVKELLESQLVTKGRKRKEKKDRLQVLHMPLENLYMKYRNCFLMNVNNVSIDSF